MCHRLRCYGAGCWVQFIGMLAWATVVKKAKAEISWRDNTITISPGTNRVNLSLAGEPNDNLQNDEVIEYDEDTSDYDYYNDDDSDTDSFYKLDLSPSTSEIHYNNASNNHTVQVNPGINTEIKQLLLTNCEVFAHNNKELRQTNLVQIPHVQELHHCLHQICTKKGLLICYCLVIIEKFLIRHQFAPFGTHKHIYRQETLKYFCSEVAQVFKNCYLECSRCVTIPKRHNLKRKCSPRRNKSR